MRDDAYTLQQIADTVDLSKARVSQILEEFDEEVTAGGYRAFLAANGELGLAELTKILRKDSPVKISASGRPAYLLDPDDPSGRTLDLSKPVLDDSVKIDAIGKLSPLLDRLSKLRGADARIEKDVADTDAIANYKQYVQEVLEERANLQKQVAELTAKYEVIPSGEPAG